MSYWVSWAAAAKRTRIHDGGCRHCNDGFGKGVMRRVFATHTGWRGPYATLGEAEHTLDLMRCVDGYDDAGVCSCVAKPESPT